jgi:hypothetical protein
MTPGPHIQLCRPAVEWNLANWDLEEWLKNMAPGGEGPCAGGLAPEKHFHNYNDQMVWRYTYNETLPQHGCVKVVYKFRLSVRKGLREAEWNPIRRRSTVTPDGMGTEEENVTTDEGVMFVPHPPDMRVEPNRESWNDDKVAENGAKAIARILKHRKGLSPAAQLEWQNLLKFHSSFHSARTLPHLPHTVEIEGDASTEDYLAPGAKSSHVYDGTPRELLPVLRELAKGRFARPFLRADWWDAEPPAAFPLKKLEHTSDNEEDDEAIDETEPGGLRDTRLANRVSHITQPAAESRGGVNMANKEDWAEQQPARVSKVIEGGLYLLQIEEAEGELFMGMARVKTENDGQLVAWWYQRCNNNFPWGEGCTFKKYGAPGAWTHDDVQPDSILLQVRLEDLTAGGQLRQLERPSLTSWTKCAGLRRGTTAPRTGL